MSKDCIGIIFGRFNPPHKGHKAAWEMASECTHWFIGTNKSTLDVRNPLPYEVKKAAMIAIWPEIKNRILPEKTWITMAANMYKKYGDIPLYCYTDEEWVVNLLKKYNNVKDKEGNYYNFSVIEKKSTPRISSASSLRKAVKEDDRDTFFEEAGVSEDFIIKNPEDNKNYNYFDLVKKYLSLQEVYMPKKYRAGLSKSTTGKRKRFWVKLGKYPYTKAEYSKAEKVPGDNDSKTRPSKYNKKYQQMFGESRSIKALQKKAKTTGIPYGILKQVYNRGMAAWVTGHRPGATQSAWAFARVNSFVTKGKTWRTTDADLAKKARRYLSEDVLNESSGTTYAWYWVPVKGLMVRKYDQPHVGEHESMAGELGLDDIDELPRGQFWISGKDKKQTSHTSYGWTPKPPSDIHLQLRKYFKIPKDWSHWSNNERKWLIRNKNVTEAHNDILKDNWDGKFVYVRSGYITPSGKVLNGNHDQLAKLNGFKNRRESISKGWIRFYITNKGESAYNFESPHGEAAKQIRLIKKHIENNVSLIKKVFIDSPELSRFTKYKIQNWAAWITGNSIDEAHMYDYLDWGWIAPTGEIVAPIESDKSHTSILRRLAEKNKFDLTPLETEYSVTKKGWIRWLVDYDQLMLNTKILLDKITIYKSIERLINKHRNLEGFLFEYEKPQGKLHTISGEKWGSFLNDIKKVYGLEESLKEWNNSSEFGIKPPNTELAKRYFHGTIDEINEEFADYLEYDMWGWVTPTGKVILPTKADADSEYEVTHFNILKPYFSRVDAYEKYDAAYESGWIRFLIEDRILYFNCILSDNLPEILIKAKNTIEEYAKNPKKFYYFIGPDAKKATRSFKKDGIGMLSIDSYDLDLKLDRWNEISTKKFNEFKTLYNLNKSSTSFANLMTRLNNALLHPEAKKFMFNEKIKENVKKSLNEEFAWYLEYDMWGWISPTGKVYLPTLKDAESDYEVTHNNLIRNISGMSYVDAISNGWIRFILQDETLQLNSYLYKNLPKALIKAKNTLENYVRDPKKFYYFIGPNVRKALASIKQDGTGMLLINDYNFYPYIITDDIPLMDKLRNYAIKHKLLRAGFNEGSESLSFSQLLERVKAAISDPEGEKFLMNNNLKEQKMDYEIEMASGQLKKIADLAGNILNYIQNQTELDAWVQDKISVSAHNMEAIYDNYFYNEGKLEEKIVNKDKKYYLISKKTGKNLGGPYSSKKKAQERERQVQYFKNK